MKIHDLQDARYRLQEIKKQLDFISQDIELSGHGEEVQKAHDSLMLSFATVYTNLQVLNEKLVQLAGALGFEKNSQ